MTPHLAVATRGVWYLTRGTGAATLILLTVSVVLGILETVRWSAPPRWPRFVIAAVHRNVSLLVLVVLGLHILTSVIDTFAPITLTDVFVPFVSSYRPIWLGLGAIASDLLIAVAITSVLRLRVGFRAWRFVHWSAYACWPLALVHGLGTGSDTKLSWMLLLSAVCIGLVLASIAVRLVRGWPSHQGLRTAAFGATVAAPIALVVWLVVGPLAPGWARRSGTPQALLAAVEPSARTSAARAATPSAATLRPPFTAQLSGTVTQTEPGNGLVSVDIATTMSGGASGRFVVTITGQPIADGGVSMTDGRVTIGPSSSPQLYSGRITSLEGTRVAAHVSSSSGRGFDVQADLQIDQSQAVSGTVQGTAGSGP